MYLYTGIWNTPNAVTQYKTIISLALNTVRNKPRQETQEEKPAWDRGTRKNKKKDYDRV